MQPTDYEIDKLIDEISCKIAYWRTVRNDAELKIEELMKARRNVLEDYNRTLEIE